MPLKFRKNSPSLNFRFPKVAYNGKYSWDCTEKINYSVSFDTIRGFERSVKYFLPNFKETKHWILGQYDVM